MTSQDMTHELKIKSLEAAARSLQSRKKPYTPAQLVKATEQIFSTLTALEDSSQTGPFIVVRESNRPEAVGE